MEWSLEFDGVGGSRSVSSDPIFDISLRVLWTLAFLLLRVEHLQHTYGVPEILLRKWTKTWYTGYTLAIVRKLKVFFAFGFVPSFCSKCEIHPYIIPCYHGFSTLYSWLSWRFKHGTIGKLLSSNQLQRFHTIRKWVDGMRDMPGCNTKKTGDFGYTMIPPLNVSSWFFVVALVKLRNLRNLRTLGWIKQNIVSLRHEV